MAASEVGILSILFMAVTILICFGVPIGLAVWAKKKYKKSFSFIPLLAGVLAFLVSQVIFRIPMMQMVLPLFDWYKQFMKMTWPYLITACFTAGLVEEPARFIAFAIMKKRRQYTDGLSLGIGHGGFEAMILTGMSTIGNLTLSLMINSGMVGQMGAAIPASTVAVMVNTPSYHFLLAGIERVFAVTLHIALSLIVLKGFQVNKKVLYLVAAILIHGLANLAAVATAQLAGALASEGVLLVISVLSVLYIVKQARGWRESLKLAEGTLNEQPREANTP